MIVITDKTGEAYSLEYTKLSEVSFTPRHVGRSCADLITGSLLGLVTFLD
jgi:hypothetical protein